MTIKWTVKDVLEHMENLIDPFEKAKPKGTGVSIADKVKEVLGRNKGVTQ